LVLESAGRRLAAVYVSAGEDAPAFLICHGIGERVEYWGEVQILLKEMGVSSLVFNYTGFGASRGQVRVSHCEEDAIAAYTELKRRGAGAVFLLGFSLGTAIASAVASQVKANGLILCEGFTSLYEAAIVAGLPRWFSAMAGDVWHTARRVGELSVPVLVVHSDGDRLFPVAMAESVVEACGMRGEKIIVRGLDHNEPIFAAPEGYWRAIVDWTKRRESVAVRAKYRDSSLRSE